MPLKSREDLERLKTLAESATPTIEMPAAELVSIAETMLHLFEQVERTEPVIPSWVYDSPNVWTSPYRMGGQPCMFGTRIPVNDIIGMFVHGATDAEIREFYPSVTEDMIREFKTEWLSFSKK